MAGNQRYGVNQVLETEDAIQLLADDWWAVR